jgi:hypothetical protein
MRKVQVWAELTDEHYHAYEAEAKRRGVTVEELVQQTVNCLLRELEEEEDEGSGPDHLISVS